MKFIKKFEKFNEVNESDSSTTKTPVKVPQAPVKPKSPTIPTPRRIDKPSDKPIPKAKVTEEDVVDRFFSELEKKGKTLKQFLKK